MDRGVRTAWVFSANCPATLATLWFSRTLFTKFLDVRKGQVKTIPLSPTYLPILFYLAGSRNRQIRGGEYRKWPKRELRGRVNSAASLARLLKRAKRVCQQLKPDQTGPPSAEADGHATSRGVHSPAAIRRDARVSRPRGPRRVACVCGTAGLGFSSGPLASAEGVGGLVETRGMGR